MADIKFSNLTGASIAADGSDILAISQAQSGGGYLSKRTTVGDVGRHAVTVQRYSALGGLTPVEAINEAMDSGITNNVKITMTKAIDAYSFDFVISNPDDSADVYFSQTYECGLFGDFQPITATFSVGGNQYALSITCNPQGQSSPLFATLVVGGKSFTINAEGSNASYPVNFLQATTLSIITAADIEYSSGVSVADKLADLNNLFLTQTYTATKSVAANGVVALTGADMGYNSIPSGYTPIVFTFACTNSNDLFCNLNDISAIGASQFGVIRNVSTGAQNDKNCIIKITFVKSSYL